MLRRLACSGRAMRHGKQGSKGDCGDQRGKAAEKNPAEQACGRGQSQRVTCARYAAIGDWRAQGVMASAGGVFWGCFSTAMLPLRRHGQLGCIGSQALAPSRRDRSRVVEFAADVIQPICRHYAAVAIIDAVSSTPYRGCNHN